MASEGIPYRVVAMKHSGWINVIGCGLFVCAIVLTRPFLFTIAAEQTSRMPEEQACTIDLLRTAEADERQNMAADAREHEQQLLSQQEKRKQSEEPASAGREAAEPRHTLPSQPLGGGSKMEQYYLGRHYKNAVFPGRLVCLRCDTMPTPENVDVCRKEGHRHALAMEGDTMVHPLIFTSEDLFTKVNAHDWYRKKVQVWGRYYADTGFIVVGDVQAEEK